MPFLLPYARHRAPHPHDADADVGAGGMASGEARVCEGAEATPPHCAGRLVELDERRWVDVQLNDGPNQGAPLTAARMAGPALL